MTPDRIGHIATWLCIATIVVLSLVPGNERPDTGFSHHLEHFAAYAGTGLIGSLAYRRPVLIIVSLCLLSSVLELLQNFVPDRHPAVVDVVFSTLGAAAGAATRVLTAIALSWRERRRQNC
jgi:VanZ family protein